jgi:hypothetical protein
VLPLVACTVKAISAWLAPAYGVLPEAGRQSLELRADLDQVEALAPKREASCRRRASSNLWARVDAEHRRSDARGHRFAMTSASAS